PLGSWRDPGPGLLPLGSGIFLGILSGIVFFQSRMRDEDQPRGSWYSKEKWKSLLLILAVLFGYAFVLDYLGFLVSTFILLLVLFRFVEPQKWFVAIGGSALASITCYVVFELWLKTQLPRGILGF
ncbi:MAG: tripartite tricarboxylate transporter TctB family protein, partial [Deltaproteobacteria bacterium]|nr:tripartite tricarboxylate transporter TctB family protein [Deltaproteobacteria bacterium]